MAVFEVADDAEVRRFLENDPTVKAGLNSFEISPMIVGGARHRPAAQRDSTE